MRVLLLTQDGCTLCEHAHELLDRLAAEYPMELAVADISSEGGRELAERGGILFPPGLVIDGEPVFYGRLSERRLRRELDRRLKTEVGR